MIQKIKKTIRYFCYWRKCGYGIRRSIELAKKTVW